MRVNRIWSRAVGAAVGVAICVAGLGLATVDAQPISGTAIQSVLQSLGGTPGSTSTTTSPPVPTQLPSAVTQGTQTLTPAPPASSTPLPASRLELLFSQRAGQPLQQYGYDFLGTGSPVTTVQIGAVQDSYILGAGDQISVVLRGHDNSAYTVPVDRDGRIIVPNYQPVTAGGRTFGEVRTELAQNIAHDALGTRTYISLATVRQISVLVTGEVNAPGIRTLSGLNTPLDAILLSGGIRKNGSLRNVILDRGGVHHRIDLYSVIAQGNAASVGALTEGDRIIVSPLGSTVAVIGLVKSPGIYELSPGSNAIDARALMRLAGGSEIAGGDRLSKIGLQSSGRADLIGLGHDGVIRSGEILSVDQAAGGTFGRVTVVGAVQLPGTHALNNAPTLSKLFQDPAELTSNAYTPFGIVVHRDPVTNFRKPQAFSLKRVFEHAEDMKLSSDDVVYVFTAAQVQALAAAAVAQLQLSSQAANVPPSVLNQSAQSLSNINLSQPAQAGGTASAQQNTAAAAPAPVVPTLQLPPGISLSSLPPAAQSAYQNAQASLAAQVSANTPPAQPAAPAPSNSGQQSAPAAPPPAPSVQTQIDPRLAAAEAGASSASVPILQAQTATAGGMIRSNGLTSPAALGAPTPDLTTAGIATQLDITPAALLNLASDYVVWVVGAVHDPGPYLAENGTTLAAMIGAAGGVQLQADLSWVEVTSTEMDPLSGTSKTSRTAYKGNMSDLERVSLRPMDSVRVRQVFSDRSGGGNVTVAGQVRYPGRTGGIRGKQPRGKRTASRHRGGDHQSRPQCECAELSAKPGSDA
jgi:protein involved in polysaccharide export with SLBB domain